MAETCGENPEPGDRLLAREEPRLQYLEAPRFGDAIEIGGRAELARKLAGNRCDPLLRPLVGDLIHELLRALRRAASSSRRFLSTP